MSKKLLWSFYTYVDKTIFCIWTGLSHLDRKTLPCEPSWLGKDERDHSLCLPFGHDHESSSNG